MVPSHWQALTLDGQMLLPSRLLVFGGEALRSEIARGIHAIGTSCRVINHYGPTETTIGKLLHPVQAGKQYGATVPIGKPFSNTRVYVLNREMERVPVGVPGQLFIAGDGVARGYFNKPETTREKFIPDTFSSEAGLVMYATGDMVKYLPDGNIEFIGRVDDQVKIRGYRIELGEIEATMNQGGYIQQAVVLAREDSQGNKRLVAYLVPHGYFDREALINDLKEKLPEYMVPSLFVELEAFPLTANGKVDRKALPDPDAGELLKDKYVAPTNETETRLAAIWQDVLEVDQVGINDDFFELGGHSLLAVRLVSAIRKEFTVEMPIGDIFDYPTVRLLAGQLDQVADVEVLTSIVPVVPRPERIPLSFSQERLWFIHQLEGSVQYHVPAALRLTGQLNKEALVHSLETIVNRHESLRTVFLEEEGKPYQSIKPQGQWRLVEVDGAKYENDQAALQTYLKEIINEPFDLTSDHMIRAHLFKLNEESHILVVTLHHIASDGWSRSILVKEVVELYSAVVEKRKAQLVGLPVQYADYAIWQRQNIQGDVLDEKLSYWKNKLQDVEVLRLPTDYPRPAVLSTRGAGTSSNIDQKLAEQIKLLSQHSGSTLFMTLLAAFKVLLYRYCHQQDICVGSPIAGRQQLELEPLIGFFVNTLALRSEVRGNQSFLELLHQIKTTTREAYEHQEVSFEKVVDEVVKE
ncbi:MAG TPA: condensation domain-containing protein, partial [Flavitalea sp.]|nr:condensation domain-containing protein [Flavitalea sp.]